MLAFSLAASFGESLGHWLKTACRGRKEATTQATSYICPAAAFPQLFCGNIHPLKKEQLGHAEGVKGRG